MKTNLSNACFSIAVFLLSLPTALLAEPAPLTLGQPIALPGTKGRFDYLQVDEKLNRLLAAHTANKTLDIISLPDGKLIKSVSTGTIQGAVVDTDHNKYYASVSAEQKLAIIDRQTLEITGTVSLPGPADALAYNPKNGLVYVCHDDGQDVWVVDPSAKKIVTADPNPHNLIDWSGMTAVKPNRAEAFLAAGVSDRDSDVAPKKDVDLVRAGKELLQKWGVQYLLVTLGENGVMFFEKGKHPHHIPTKARDVFDVSGAGDTAIAMFTLALASNATPLEAAQIANHASAVVVGKLGTATVTRDELIASFEHDFG